MAGPQLIDISQILAADSLATSSTGEDGYGVTPGGFVPKPFARLLAERIATARELFGADIDLSSSSVLKKVLEVSALEDARLWAAMAQTYDASFIATATGSSLSMLGEELGLSRPHQHARGRVVFELDGNDTVTLPLGTRLLTPGNHHVATLAAAALSPETPSVEVEVEAFHPGPSHNLDPSSASEGLFLQRIDAFHPLSPGLPAGHEHVTIVHGDPLTGGDERWGDESYRALLVNAPRSLWTARALELAIELVPGVRAVMVRDPYGGLDVEQAIFGEFNFIERVFTAQRDPFGLYQAKIVVAPTAAAIWEGPDGLEVAIRTTIDDLRPVGIHPEIRRATQVGIRVTATVSVRGTPLKVESPTATNASAAARALRDRLNGRLRAQVERLGFGEPVRAARLTWALMDDPFVADVCDLKVERFVRFQGFVGTPDAECQTVALGPDEVGVFMAEASELTIERSA